MLTVSWEHPACCGWDRELEYTVVLECMDCFNESLSTKHTNTSFLKSQNGLYNVFISTKNKCGETITVNASHMVDNDTGVPEYVHIFSANHADIPVCNDTVATCFTATGNLATAESAGCILLTVGTHVHIHVHVCMVFGISLYYMLDPTLL